MAIGLEPPRGERGYYVWLRKDSGEPFLVGRLSVDDTGWSKLTVWPKQKQFIHVFQHLVVSEPESATEQAPSRPVLLGSLAPR